MSISTSLRKGIVVLVTLSCLPAFASTEQEQLAQAIKQLEAAKLSLQRAEKVAKASPKTREYFNYSAIHRDIETVKGIQQYINPSRALPRDPNVLRTLSEDYSKLRGQ
ncbi:RAQPRD family integrative conjugative element protein [Mannheimia haemolytica]|nr:RAQPRD family integrative conjugative element protein [Mannheimia haemolytica]